MLERAWAPGASPFGPEYRCGRDGVLRFRTACVRSEDPIRQGGTMTCNPRHRPGPLAWERTRPDESIAASSRFLAVMSRRRSIRDFSPDPVPYELIRTAVATAATAP